METQRILVTGGAGFIGTNLVNELRRRGHEVVAADLMNTDREDYIRADTRSYRQLERVSSAPGSTTSTTSPPSTAAGTAKTTTRTSGRPTWSGPSTCSVSRRS